MLNVMLGDAGGVVRSVGLRILCRIPASYKMIWLLLCLLLVPASYAVPSSIVRPCYLNDYSCIGSTLAAHSACSSRVYGEMPSRYTIPSFLFETPFFNATYIDANLTVTNHNNCNVYDYFVNLATDNSVLAIRCTDLGFASTRTLIQHYAGAEDVIYNYDYSGVYPEIIITVNMRPASVVELCSAPAFAYVSALPNFNVKPNDDATDNFLSSDLTFLNIYERETFFYRANELIRYFINSMLCDFGCDF